MLIGGLSKVPSGQVSKNRSGDLNKRVNGKQKDWIS